MVQLPENRRFFQYLQSDSSLLGGNVIAIFSKKYGKDETPDINDVVSDSVEYICHTVINHGVELGLWTKYGNVQTNVQLDKVYFKDYVDRPWGGGAFWQVWQVDGDDIRFKELPTIYESAYRSVLFTPDCVYIKCLTGKFLGEDY